MNAQQSDFYGRFRGVVTDNRDPLSLGRIKARVPDVFGDMESGWALPSLPYAGKDVGFFFIPPPGASVWMEFEHGDPDYPVWTGCFWAQGEVPASPALADFKVIKTATGTITLNDTPGAGGICIETADKMKIEISQTGISIDNGQGGTVKLSGPRVSINDDALEVT